MVLVVLALELRLVVVFFLAAVVDDFAADLPLELADLLDLRVDFALDALVPNSSSAVESVISSTD